LRRQQAHRVSKYVPLAMVVGMFVILTIVVIVVPYIK
jgi:hypothetical protein